NHSVSSRRSPSGVVYVRLHATLNVVNARPLGVYRISGSPPRFPIIVALQRPAIVLSLSHSAVSINADDDVPKNLLVQSQHAVEVDRLLGIHRKSRDVVCAVDMPCYGIGKPPAAPEVEAFDLATARAHEAAHALR